MITSLSTVLSSTKFICCTSFSFCNQLASSILVPSCSSEPLLANSLCQPKNWVHTHQLSLHSVFIVHFYIIMVNSKSFTLSSQPSVTAAALLFMSDWMKSITHQRGIRRTLSQFNSMISNTLVKVAVRNSKEYQSIDPPPTRRLKEKLDVSNT